MNRLYLIASSKPWNKNLASQLSNLTGKKFIMLTNPTDLCVDYLSGLNPAYIFFPHWSHRIPDDVISAYDCIVFHMTDLPFGRGGSPLQNLIVRGIYDTKISALKCVSDLDAGPIYLKRSLSLHGNAEEIYLRASKIMEEMILEMAQKMPSPIPQVGEATFFSRRKPYQGNLKDAKSLNEVFDLIRMLDAEGYPNAFIDIGDIRFEFTRASRKTEEIIADVKITIRDNKF